MARLRRNGEPLTAANVEQRIKELYANVFVVNTGVEQLQTALTSLQTSSAKAIMELNKEIEQLRRQLEQQSATMSPSGRQQTQVGFGSRSQSNAIGDIVSEGTGGVYTSADVQALFEYSKTRFVGTAVGYFADIHSPLAFMFMVHLDAVIQNIHKVFSAECIETKQTISPYDLAFFEFAVFMRNLTALKKWTITSQKIGAQIISIESQDINDARSGKIVEILLPRIQELTHIRSVVRV